MTRAPGRLGDLDARHADAAGRAGHQHGLADLDRAVSRTAFSATPAPGPERAAHLERRCLSGTLHERILRQGDVLGIAAAHRARGGGRSSRARCGKAGSGRS